MSDELYTLKDLKAFIAKEEEENGKLQYESYLKNLITLVEERNPKVVNSINFRNDAKEYICIKEPTEFIELFSSCDGQKDCRELFIDLVQKRDKRVVSQVITRNNNDDGLWFNSTLNGINLRPGLENEEWSSPTAIELGDNAVHGMVAGRTGSGKSVFLNNIIFSLLAEYAPWELDLFLADFKKVEFSRYLSNYQVPHIKAVAATSEIRYVVSLLRYLAKCMNARQNFFSLMGLQKLSDFREEFGVVLPRVLFIVDEFQQLFLETTNKESMEIHDLIVAITKLGRATGFHLLFASQEMTGTTMGTSLFANFKARFALSCEADVSSLVLGNNAASRITEKGIVIANAGNGKEETNQTYKVPFITKDYFYDYLERITDSASKVGFTSVHKFYQEDNIKDISELEKVLDAIRPVREQYIESNTNIFDIITLGEAVVFNYKKFDYETVFLERGVRKNIGIFSPSVDDTAYVCKLLSENFVKSPRAKQYRHLICQRNDLFTKKFDLAKALNVSKDDVYSSVDILSSVIEAFKKRHAEASLINQYNLMPSLQEFAYEAFCLRAEYISYATDEEKKVLFEQLRILSDYYEGKEIDDIPNVQKNILEDYEVDESYFRIINLLYQKHTEGKTTAQLFEPLVIWIIGAEMVGKYPRDMEMVLADALNYNMLFVLVASNADFNEFTMLQKTCDYKFISGNNESYYNKLRVPFTKKTDDSLAIDFAITSTETQRSFKKFRFDLEEIVVPEIDFDSIL